MNKMIENVWDEYFAEECSVIDTTEERELSKMVVECYDTAISTLTERQKDAIEDYVDALCELQSSFLRKAFFKGCQFSASFVFETLVCNKNTKS